MLVVGPVVVRRRRCVEALCKECAQRGTCKNVVLLGVRTGARMRVGVRTQKQLMRALAAAPTLTRDLHTSHSIYSWSWPSRVRVSTAGHGRFSALHPMLTIRLLLTGPRGSPPRMHPCATSTPAPQTPLSTRFPEYPNAPQACACRARAVRVPCACRARAVRVPCACRARAVRVP